VELTDRAAAAFKLTGSGFPRDYLAVEGGGENYKANEAPPIETRRSSMAHRTSAFRRLQAAERIKFLPQAQV